ncbi:hypothetical protein AMECASPLE_009726 [Ameca splendens]|uniref:Uncharacterized protein n=1 Tax=Ameca splendens TaxID=208324 RepID=A0ABV0Z941_9TELE
MFLLNLANIYLPSVLPSNMDDADCADRSPEAEDSAVKASLKRGFGCTAPLSELRSRMLSSWLRHGHHFS